MSLSEITPSVEQKLENHISSLTEEQTIEGNNQLLIEAYFEIIKLKQKIANVHDRLLRGDSDKELLELINE